MPSWEFWKEDIGQKSYKLQIHQQLEEDDFDRRVEMAQVLWPVLQLPANNRRIFYLIFFTLYLIFFVDSTVDADNYLEMLKSYFFPILQKKRLTKQIIFQQDGAPPHYSLEVRNWLNEKFPGKWTGRRGPIEWAPRSPDLTPLDFFLWGYLKQKVYMTPIKDLAELRLKITEHCQ